MEKPGCLGFLGDDTTQLEVYYNTLNKPLNGCLSKPRIQWKVGGLFGGSHGDGEVYPDKSTKIWRKSFPLIW